MTNEEMIFCCLKEHTLTDKELLAMLAELKDKQFAKEKQALIDKACEWLRNNMYKGTCEQMLSKKPYLSMSDFTNELKNAMKGGNL